MSDIPGWLREMRPGDPVRVVINGTLEDVCDGVLYRSGGGKEAHGLVMVIAHGGGGELRLLVDDTSATVTPLVPAGVTRE